MVDVRIWGLIFSVPAVTGLARAVAYRDEEERSSRRDSAVFLLLLSALPLVIALAIGLVIRFYEYRYLSFCVAPYCADRSGNDVLPNPRGRSAIGLRCPFLFRLRAASQLSRPA